MQAKIVPKFLGLVTDTQGLCCSSLSPPISEIFQGLQSRYQLDFITSYNENHLVHETEIPELQPESK